MKRLVVKPGIQLRTGWPWGVAALGLPQTRTCSHESIRFVKSWVRCVLERGARLLENQLKDFLIGDHDDGPDALRMAP